MFNWSAEFPNIELDCGGSVLHDEEQWDFCICGPVGCFGSDLMLLFHGNPCEEWIATCAGLVVLKR